jgi:hypothetical protein
MLLASTPFALSHFSTPAYTPHVGVFSAHPVIRSDAEVTKEERNYKDEDDSLGRSPRLLAPTKDRSHHAGPQCRQGQIVSPTLSAFVRIYLNLKLCTKIPL